VYLLSKEIALDKTKLGKFNRTTIPESVRKLLQVKEGDYVEWIFNDGRILVRKASYEARVEGRV
jgi:AbrB family looped-hinge helix DNA binding protein